MFRNTNENICTRILGFCLASLLLWSYSGPNLTNKNLTITGAGFFSKPDPFLYLKLANQLYQSLRWNRKIQPEKSSTRLTFLIQSLTAEGKVVATFTQSMQWTQICTKKIIVHKTLILTKLTKSQKLFTALKFSSVT